MTIEDIRKACDDIEALRPMAGVRPDVVAEETLSLLSGIVSNAERLRDAMLLPAHRAGLNVRHISRVSGLSHVTVGKRLAASQDTPDDGTMEL